MGSLIPFIPDKQRNGYGRQGVGFKVSTLICRMGKIGVFVVCVF